MDSAKLTGVQAAAWAGVRAAVARVSNVGRLPLDDNHTAAMADAYAAFYEAIAIYDASKRT